MNRTMNYTLYWFISIILGEGETELMMKLTTFQSPQSKKDLIKDFHNALSDCNISAGFCWLGEDFLHSI